MTSTHGIEYVLPVRLSRIWRLFGFLAGSVVWPIAGGKGEQGGEWRKRDALELHPVALYKLQQDRPDSCHVLLHNHMDSTQPLPRVSLREPLGFGLGQRRAIKVLQPQSTSDSVQQSAYTQPSLTGRDPFTTSCAGSWGDRAGNNRQPIITSFRTSHKHAINV